MHESAVTRGKEKENEKYFVLMSELHPTKGELHLNLNR